MFERLETLLDEQLGRLKSVLDDDVPAFNELVREERVPALVVED